MDSIERNAKESYRQFFKSLEPDGGGEIHVSTFKEVIKKGMGDQYDDAKASEMIADVLQEVDGKISIDGLAEAFSTGPSSSEMALGLHSVLEYCPELLPTHDFKHVFDMFGINITPEEAVGVIEEARKSFSDRLGKRFDQEPPPKDKNELKVKQIGMMKMLGEQITRLGGAVPNIDDEDGEPI